MRCRQSKNCVHQIFILRSVSGARKDEEGDSRDVLLEALVRAMLNRCQQEDADMHRVKSGGIVEDRLK